MKENIVKLGGTIPVELFVKITGVITEDYPDAVIRNGDNGFYEIVLNERKDFVEDWELDYFEGKDLENDDPDEW